MSDAALGSAIAAAETALFGSTDGDPAADLRTVEQATASLDAALAATRDAAARASASRDQYDRLRLSTIERIRQAEGYITTRRGGVGTAARTRLAEAHRLLAHASRQAESAPEAAAATALQASNHAEQAFRLARADVASFGSSPAARTAGGAVIGGAVLGGIARSGARRPADPTAASARRPSTGGSSRRETGAKRGGRRGTGGRFST